jgi:NAD(P)-dependent dehydrogenase (short-subunit alcohol dehydrogenase family)
MTMSQSGGSADDSASKSLAGRVCLVTGASKGIGHAIVRALGAQGAFVIAHYGSDRAGAESATHEIEDKKLLIHADLATPDGYAALWQEAAAWKGRVDVLVANAAVMPEASLTDSEEVWRDAFDLALNINVRSTALLIRKAVNHFLEIGGGSIIGMSSWAAQQGSGNPKLSGYAASKAPIAALLKTIARAYGKESIFAYLISPGIVRTAMSENSAKSMGGEDVITARLAMGEWVPPEEIAELVAFLASGKNRHLSGSTFDVNGATYIR